MGLVFDLDRIAGRFGGSAKQFLGERVYQHDPGFAVAHHDGIAHVFDDQFEPVTVLTHNFFCFTQFVVIGAQLLIGAAHVSYVAHHGHGADLNAIRAVGGRGDCLKQHLFAFDSIHQGQVAVRIAAGNQHGRERGGEQQVIQLNRAHQAFSHLVGHFEEALCGLVLHDNAVLRIGQNHGISHALHHCSHLRNGDLHVTHAVVIMLNLEQAGEIAVGQLHEFA